MVFGHRLGQKSLTRTRTWTNFNHAVIMPRSYRDHAAIHAFALKSAGDQFGMQGMKIFICIPKPKFLSPKNCFMKNLEKRGNFEKRNLG